MLRDDGKGNKMLQALAKKLDEKIKVALISTSIK